MNVQQIIESTRNCMSPTSEQTHMCIFTTRQNDRPFSIVLFNQSKEIVTTLSFDEILKLRNEIQKIICDEILFRGANTNETRH